MPRLSIVIPVVGAPQQLEDTLVSVLQNRPDDCEILVVHNRPYDDPYQLSDEVRFIAASRGSRLVDCVNVGIASSGAPVVHVLACGVEVDAGWTTAPLRHFRHLYIAAVGAVVLDRDEPGKIISAGVGYRREGTAWRIGGQATAADGEACPHDFRGPDTLAAFYRKSAVEAVGGLSASAGDALASVDLALALAQAGFRCVLEPRCIARVDASMIARPWAFRQGYHAERIFWRWASSHGWVSSLAAHAAVIAGQSVIGIWRPSMLVQLFGRACGTLAAALATGRASRETAAPGAEVLPSAATRLPVSRRHDERPSARAA